MKDLVNVVSLLHTTIDTRSIVERDEGERIVRKFLLGVKHDFDVGHAWIAVGTAVLIEKGPQSLFVPTLRFHLADEQLSTDARHRSATRE